jgi:hypothetical protein
MYVRCSAVSANHLAASRRQMRTHTSLAIIHAAGILHSMISDVKSYIIVAFNRFQLRCFFDRTLLEFSVPSYIWMLTYLDI